MKQKLFMLVLGTDIEIPEGEWNFRHISQEIISSKDEFNETVKDRQLFIVGIYEDYIKAVLNVKVSNDKARIGKKSISRFVRTVNTRCCMEDNPVKVQEMRSMEPEELKNIIASMKRNRDGVYNRTDAEKIMEGITESINSQEGPGKDGCNDDDKEEEKKNVPNRRPPFLRDNAEKQSCVPCGDSLQQTIDELNSLIGLPAAKAEIEKILRIISNTAARNRRLNLKNTMICNTTIGGDVGTGKDTIAMILFRMFYHTGIVKHDSFIKIENKEITRWNIVESSVRNLQGGCVYIDGIDPLVPEKNEKPPRNNQFENIAGEIEKYSDRFTFIISGRSENIDKFSRFGRMKNLLKFNVTIDNYTTEELVGYGKMLAGIRQYRLTNDAERSLKHILDFLKDNDKLEYMHTTRKIIDDAIIKNTMRVDYNTASEDEMCSLSKEDFNMDIKPKAEEKTVEKNDPMKELQSMIGIEGVKKRVKEIAAFVQVQIKRKESGINTEPICLHTVLTGAPGTGKTTVARYLGKILYNMGALKKDKFVEVSREDLIGMYVGHTAVKTSEVINEAMGGVLFIDEAYSLFHESRNDFGHECVSTLLKHMEDKRDRFVVFFAGYSNEMDRFLNMNPGLRSRIGFNIDFPDYGPQEMTAIFKKFCSDSSYNAGEDCLLEIHNIFAKAYSNRDSNFSNGRLVRNCFEKVKLYQSLRLADDNLFDEGELLKIKLEDIMNLYEDEDIKTYIKGAEGSFTSRTIGFAVEGKVSA